MCKYFEDKHKDGIITEDCLLLNCKKKKKDPMLLRVCTVTDHRRCLCFLCHFCVLTTFWYHLWSIAEQMHICIIGNLFVHQNILNLHAHKEYHTTFSWLFSKMIFFLSSTTKNANSVSHAWSALNLLKLKIKRSQPMNCNEELKLSTSLYYLLRALHLH